MKKQFETPMMEIVLINEADIICTSGCTSVSFPGEEELETNQG